MKVNQYLKSLELFHYIQFIDAIFIDKNIEIGLFLRLSHSESSSLKSIGLRHYNNYWYLRLDESFWCSKDGDIWITESEGFPTFLASSAFLHSL